MRKIDQSIIDTIRQEYISSTASIESLADKYHLSRSTLQRASTREKWRKSIETIDREIESRSLNTVSTDKCIDYRSGLYALAYSVANQLADLTKEHNLKELAKMGIKPRDITGAIKDLEESLHIKSDLALKEQEARIKALEKQIEANNEASKEIVITMSADVEEYSK